MLFLLLSVGCRACTVADGIADRVTDPDNIIHDYEWFHTAHERVASRVAQIKTTREMLEDTTGQILPDEKTRLRVEIMGQQQSCRELVADYNANSQKMTVGIFKGWSLPDTLNPSVCE